MRGRLSGLRELLEPVRGAARLLAAAASIVLALASPAPALAATGAISGKVTASGTGEPLVGIEVCAVTTTAFEHEGEGEGGAPELGSEQASCTTAGAGGAYTISGLGAGTFFVGFGNPTRGTLDYVTQYYKDEPTLEEANPVTVTAGATTTGVDAELHEGAELSGVVTSAATGAPLEGALVCAVPQPSGAHAEVACGFSGAQGAYTVFGVEAGSVVVYAFAQGYTPTFYGGSAEVSAARRLTLGTAERIHDLDIALQPSASSPGLAASSGPTSASSTGPSAVLPSGVTPTTSSASSAGVVLANSTISVHARRKALVRLKCSATTECRGTVALSAEHGRRRGRKLVESSMRIGSAHYSARPGQTVAVTVALGRAGRSLLAATHGRLAARLRIHQSLPSSSGAITKRVLILSAHAAKRKHRTRRHARLARSWLLAGLGAVALPAHDV